MERIGTVQKLAFVGVFNLNLGVAPSLLPTPHLNCVDFLLNQSFGEDHVWENGFAARRRSNPQHIFSPAWDTSSHLQDKLFVDPGLGTWMRCSVCVAESRQHLVGFVSQFSRGISISVCVRLASNLDFCRHQLAAFAFDYVTQKRHIVNN